MSNAEISSYMRCFYTCKS